MLMYAERSLVLVILEEIILLMILNFILFSKLNHLITKIIIKKTRY